MALKISMKILSATMLSYPVCIPAPVAVSPEPDGDVADAAGGAPVL